MDDLYSPPRRRRGRPSTATGATPSTFAVSPNSYAEAWSAAETSTMGSSTARATASRIVNSVRRSFSVSARKRDASPLDSGMYSTHAERIPPVPSRFDFRDAFDTRPTIEQIAMGLHISRTPHLRQNHSPLPSPHTRGYPGNNCASPNPLARPSPKLHVRRFSTSAVTPVSLPSPRRSSLKKPGTPTTTRSAPLTPTGSDLSLSTLTSNAPSTPRSGRSVSVAFIPARLQLSMARLLPSRKGSESSRSMSPAVVTGSEDDLGSGELTPRKMVRFSSGVHVRDDADSA